VPGPISKAARFYRAIWDRRSPEELYRLAHIKRFLECVVGDAGFRKMLFENMDNLRPVADACGIDIDPSRLLPIFSRAHAKHRFSQDVGAQFPLVKLWDDYMADMQHHLEMLRELGDTSKTNPYFHAWRQRQISRCQSEFGFEAKAITHPVIAFELSEGCSVGCWFCGISAERFRGYWPYDEANAALWRAVLEQVNDLFGTGAQTGFCYWATDPSDNPDYPRFIEDYYEIVGALPQTTTAAPLKNLAWTRAVLALASQHRFVCNRFSLLTLKALHQVHRAFTPEELLGVELVQHQRDSLACKANAGRAMERKKALEKDGKPAPVGALNINDEATIACISGFLVNMVTRNVQLVTPTRASERWPLGYRIHAEGRFATAAEFRALVEDMIEMHMPQDLSGEHVLAFRPDLSYIPLADGFELVGKPRTKLVIRSEIIRARYVGELIAEGNRTAGDITTTMVRAGGDVFEMAAFLRQLFDMGVFDDDPLSGKIGQRVLPAAS
jgi:radical SAM family RiPP maturation amino acid epimerase